MTRAVRDEAGETLIEIVIAIGVLAIAVTGLLDGLITSWGASSEHRNISTADTILRTYAEEAKYEIQLQASPWYQDCATVTNSPAAYNGHQLPAPANLPSGWTQPYIQGMAYWNWSGAFDAICQAGDYQVLTLAVLAPDGTLKTITIGLRSPT